MPCRAYERGLQVKEAWATKAEMRFERRKSSNLPVPHELHEYCFVAGPLVVEKI